MPEITHECLRYKITLWMTGIDCICCCETSRLNPSCAGLNVTRSKFLHRIERTDKSALLLKNQTKLITATMANGISRPTRRDDSSGKNQDNNEYAFHNAVLNDA